jgi:hypothetical protein
LSQTVSRIRTFETQLRSHRGLSKSARVACDRGFRIPAELRARYCVDSVEKRLATGLLGAA